MTSLHRAGSTSTTVEVGFSLARDGVPGHTDARAYRSRSPTSGVTPLLPRPIGRISHASSSRRSNLRWTARILAPVVYWRCLSACPSPKTWRGYGRETAVQPQGVSFSPGSEQAMIDTDMFFSTSRTRLWLDQKARSTNTSISRVICCRTRT